MVPAAWHARPAEDALRELRSTSGGLSGAEASARLERFGPNRLPEARGPSAARLLLEQVATPLMAALVASGALAMALGRREDGTVVLAVVVLNALIGFGQEHRAGRAIAALGRLIAEPARVRRDGAWRDVSAEQVVPGDVVEVAQGAGVTADLRLLEAAGLCAQESALTGEAEPVGKRPGISPEGAPLAERHGMLYAGTVVVAGSARGVAVATGSATELGRIAALVRSVDSLATPLTRSLDRFGRTVTAIIAAAAAVLAAVAALRGFPAADAALAGIGIAVAAVPEGLPAVVTIALAIGVQRMARRRAIIRRLPAVETLGATTVIATDKTGTLTCNRMTVRAVMAPDGDARARREVLRAGSLCNDAQPAAEGEEPLGDPTETALLRAAEEGGVRVREERAAWPRLAVRPFDAASKLMATLHADPAGGTTALVKGAPEAIIGRCAGDVAWARAAVQACTGRGERVLMLARRRGASAADLDGPLDRLELLGIEAMTDPLRPGAADAVRACHTAGIRVVMITGDHPRTAAAIAASAGLAPAPVALGPMHAAFGSAALDARELLWAAGVALVVLPITWLEERLRPDRRITRSAAPRPDGSARPAARARASSPWPRRRRRGR